MIRFAWLQSRTQTAMTFAALGLVAILLTITGPHLVHVYDATVATCASHGDCSQASSALIANDTFVQNALDAVLLVVPALIGVFWGAPLVTREFETGTFRLVWSQSVSRRRWLAAKVGVVGLISMAVAGLLSWMATWWFSPIDVVNEDRFSTVFGVRDIAPIGYAAFAFALGVTAGVLIRRTLPAMATTLVAFVVVRLSFNHWIAPDLVTPAKRAMALNPGTTGFGSSGFTWFGSHPSMLQPSPPEVPNAWVISTQIVDKAGHGLSSGVLKADCPLLGTGGIGPGPGPVGLSGRSSHHAAPAGAAQTLHDCVVKVGASYHEVVNYQPASRFWEYQWDELAIFVGTALILAGFCAWWLRHRVS